MQTLNQGKPGDELVLQENGGHGHGLVDHAGYAWSGGVEPLWWRNLLVPVA